MRPLPISRRPLLGTANRTCTAARDHFWPWSPAKVRKSSMPWAFRTVLPAGTNIGAFLRPASPSWPRVPSTAERCEARRPRPRSRFRPPITAADLPGTRLRVAGPGARSNRDWKGPIRRWSVPARPMQHGRTRSTTASGSNRYVLRNRHCRERPPRRSVWEALGLRERRGGRSLRTGFTIHTRWMGLQACRSCPWPGRSSEIARGFAARRALPGPWS